MSFQTISYKYLLSLETVQLSFVLESKMRQIECHCARFNMNELLNK